MTSKKAPAALLALTCLLLVPMISAASLGGAQRTPPPAGDNEKIIVREDGPSILIPRVILATDESANEQDTGEAWKERKVIIRTEGNRGLGAFLETVLAIRGTVATGVEGLLNGVVGGLFGGAKPVEEEDSR